MKLTIAAVLILLAASSAFAQVDTTSLRSKYGAPLDRETFMVRPGIEMVVDYGPSRQACKMRLPSGAQYVGTVPDGSITKQQIDEVLEEVVPISTRGKELNRMLMATGAPMLSVVEYEHVTIRELKVGGRGEGITVTFKDSGCPSRADR